MAALPGGTSRRHEARRYALSATGLEDEDLDGVLGQASRAASLRDARVLVTGATGWFGAWILDALVALDRVYDLRLRIVAMSRAPERFAGRFPALFRAPAIEWVAGDIRRPLQLEGGLTHVIHAAADTAVPRDDAARVALSGAIVDGTRNVLDLAVARGVQRMLFVSSGAIYGPQPAGLARIDEDFDGVPDPSDTYGIAKRTAEAMCAETADRTGLVVPIARCFAFVGPHMPLDAHFAIGNFIADAAHGRPIVVRGDGSPLRSYLHASDLVVWLLAILVDGASARPYNVGGDEAISIEALARRCAGSATSVVVERRTVGGSSYVPSTRRAADELGLVQTIDLAQAIARTARWARTHAPDRAHGSSA